jgi:hypothetical protein
MTDEGFTTDEHATLVALLDILVPPSADGHLPGAGSLHLTGRMLRAIHGMPMLRPVVEYGLSAIADLARTRNAESFAALSPGERKELFTAFAADDQFFLPALLFLVYSSYYQSGEVLAALGLEARAPHPNGHAMEAEDLTALLEPVRRRGRIWRDA